MAARRNMTQHRATLRQLRDGVQGGELCVPCQEAVFQDDFGRIGGRLWLNDSLADNAHLTEPAVLCTLCRHILRAKEYARRKGIPDSVGAVDLDWVMIGMNEAILVHDEGADLDGEDAGLLEGFTIDKCNYARSISDKWADVKRIKSWLGECENEHGEICNEHRTTAGKEKGNLLLVDVIDGCLVQGTFEERYLALSYVWGSSKQFLTLKDNYDLLREKGSLSMQPITQTIQDAIYFTKELGERYLWVDTLCIIQDDLATKVAAIEQMGAIYSRAVATIIAMSGSSAEDGLAGVPPTSRNTSAAYIAPGLRIIERTQLEHAINAFSYGSEDFVYSTRAWTFQERLLSNRSIIFMKEQVFMECKSILLSEDRYEHEYSGSAIFTLEKARAWSTGLKSRNRKYNPAEEFRWYEEVIQEYTSKRMGYPDDIINAFVGVQTQLGKLFDWLFFEGLPTPLLDLALLWTPVAAIEGRVTSAPHPSWSWAGWIGRVHYKDLVRPMEHLGIGDLFEPLATWKLDSPGTIRFDCECIDLNAFQVSAIDKRLYNSHANALMTPDVRLLHDSRGRRCGILYGDVPCSNSTSSIGKVELLRLSRWKRAHTMFCWGPRVAHLVEANVQEEDLFDESFWDTEGCTYNVLVVRWWGAGWLRVAIGQMHRDAWAAAKPCRKTIAVQ